MELMEEGKVLKIGLVLPRVSLKIVEIVQATCQYNGSQVLSNLQPNLRKIICLLVEEMLVKGPQLQKMLCTNFLSDTIY